MIINRDNTGTVESLKAILDETLKSGKVKSLLLMSCDANGYTPETIDQVIKDTGVPIIGGIFPAVIHGKNRLEKGNVVVGSRNEIEIKVIKGLSDPECDFEALIDKAIPDITGVTTLMTFVDGFSKRISSFIEDLFTVFGLEINYVGGGAGSLDMKQKPCLFTNDGLIEDGAVIALLKCESGVGVSHGWRSVSAPFQVTASDRNIIRTLDSRPAFEVYSEVIKEHSGTIIDPEAFFDVAKAYPFGIAKMGAESVVRDPLMVEPDGSLVCVGEVPEGSFVDILNGDNDSLIGAAEEACKRAEAAFGKPDDNHLVFFIDCISRVLFLNESFGKELEAVYRPNEPLVGACTIGEIANNGKDYLEFYNKTSVVGILGEL